MIHAGVTNQKGFASNGTAGLHASGCGDQSSMSVDLRIPESPNSWNWRQATGGICGNWLRSSPPAPTLWAHCHLTPDPSSLSILSELTCGWLQAIGNLAPTHLTISPIPQGFSSSVSCPGGKKTSGPTSVRKCHQCYRKKGLTFLFINIILLLLLFILGEASLRSLGWP